MPWRLHLTNQRLARLDMVTAQIVAAWTKPGRVYYFDGGSGVNISEKSFSDLDNRAYDHWQTLLPEIAVRGEIYPPVLLNDETTIFLSQSGQLRLYHLDSGEVILNVGPTETKFSETFLHVALDRSLGLIGALNADGCLHVFQQNIPIKQFKIDLPTFDADEYTAIAIPTGGKRLFVAHGFTLLEIDTSGKILQRRDLHYPIGAFACAAGGQWIVCSDRETNVIRVYDGADLKPHYQRHAADLLLQARQIQLLADLPPTRVALRNVAISNDGTLAFALAGVICVAKPEDMNAVPHA